VKQAVLAAVAHDQQQEQMAALATKVAIRQQKAMTAALLTMITLAAAGVQGLLVERATIRALWLDLGATALHQA
jgi:hypothetical protein